MFEVYNMNASKNLFCTTVAREKSEDDGVMNLVLSVL